MNLCCGLFCEIRTPQWGNEHVYIAGRTKNLKKAMDNTRNIANGILSQGVRTLSKYDVVCTVSSAMRWYPAAIISGLADMFSRWSKLDVWPNRKDEFAVSAAVVRSAAVKQRMKLLTSRMPYQAAVVRAFSDIPLTTSQSTYDSHIVGHTLLELVDDVIVLR